MTEIGTFCLGEGFDATEIGTFCSAESFDTMECGITDTDGSFGVTVNVIFCQDDKKD